MAHELFEIQIKTSINHSLQLIDILLDQDPTRGRDSMIHKQVRLIRELVALTRYVHPTTGEWWYDDPDPVPQPNNANHNDADGCKQVEFAAHTTLPD